MSTNAEPSHRPLTGLTSSYDHFPTLPTPEVIQDCHQVWSNAHSENVLQQIVCAACARNTQMENITHYAEHEVPNLHLLQVPHNFLSFLRQNHPDEWAELFTYRSATLDYHFLEREGITYHEEGHIYVSICIECRRALEGSDIGFDSTSHLPRARRPNLSLANGLWCGPIPECISILTPAEVLTLGLSRASAKCVFFCKDAFRSGDQEDRQRATKGQWLAWPQYPDPIVTHITALPLPPNDLAAVLHISLTSPNEQSIQPLFSVSILRVKEAFEWLRSRNHLYGAINWSNSNAELYVEGQVPPEIGRSVIEDQTFSVDERSDYIREPDSDDDEDDEEGLETNASGVLDINGLGPSITERHSSGIHNVLGKILSSLSTAFIGTNLL